MGHTSSKAYDFQVWIDKLSGDGDTQWSCDGDRCSDLQKALVVARKSFEDWCEWVVEHDRPAGSFRIVEVW